MNDGLFSQQKTGCRFGVGSLPPITQFAFPWARHQPRSHVITSLYTSLLSQPLLAKHNHNGGLPRLFLLLAFSLGRLDTMMAFFFFYVLVGRADPPFSRWRNQFLVGPGTCGCHPGTTFFLAKSKRNSFGFAGSWLWTSPRGWKKA